MQTLRQLLDEVEMLGIKDISEICTKKYHKGKLVKGVPKKYQPYINFGFIPYNLNGIPTGFNWTNEYYPDECTKIVMYFTDTLVSYQQHDCLRSLHIEHDNLYVSDFSFDKKLNKSSITRYHELDLSRIREFGEITDASFFCIGVEMDLSGLTKNELHYIMKLANRLIGKP